MVPSPPLMGQGSLPTSRPTHSRVLFCCPTTSLHRRLPHDRLSQWVQELHGPQWGTAGHAPMGPHTALLVALPWQPRPPCWGAGESHDRLSVTAPIPQRTGHGVSSAHGPQAPSTGHGGSPGQSPFSVSFPSHGFPGGSTEGAGLSHFRFRLRLDPAPRHVAPHGSHWLQGPHAPPTGHMGLPPLQIRSSFSGPPPQFPPH